MVVNINDITLTNEVLEKFEKTLMSNASLKNIRNNEKYLMLDLKTVDPSKIDFTGLSKNLVSNFLEIIEQLNNREFFGMIFKYIETPNEQYLWDYLVDCGLISDKVYQANTYEQNLDILFKHRKD